MLSSVVCSVFSRSLTRSPSLAASLAETQPLGSAIPMAICAKESELTQNGQGKQSTRRQHPQSNIVEVLESKLRF